MEFAKGRASYDPLGIKKSPLQRNVAEGIVFTVHSLCVRSDEHYQPNSARTSALVTSRSTDGRGASKKDVTDNIHCIANCN